MFASCASATILAASAWSFFAIVSGLSIFTSTAPAATSCPRTTGMSATRPWPPAAMSSRVASPSPCTSRGSPRTRYQIDSAATAAATTPTMMDGTRVGAGGGRLGASLDGGGGAPSLGGSGAAGVRASGVGISIPILRGGYLARLRVRQYRISNSLRMIIRVAIVLLLHHRWLIVTGSAAVESERHQAAADHQTEYDADAQERIAPVRQLDAAGVCRPPLIGAEQRCSEQQTQDQNSDPPAGHIVLPGSRSAA